MFDLKYHWQVMIGSKDDLDYALVITGQQCAPVKV